MWNKFRVEKGLEWISKNKKITITRSNDYVDVQFYPDTRDNRLNKNGHIALYLRLHNTFGVVVDLYNQRGLKDCWGRGYGSLVFNTGIQVLLAWYDKDVEISGTVVGCDLTKEGGARRHHFWQSFGFKIEEDIKSDRVRMSAKLSELKIKKEGQTSDGGDILIPLSEFWRPIHRPVLFKETFCAASQVDLKLLSPNNDGVKKTKPGQGFMGKIARFVGFNKNTRIDPKNDNNGRKRISAANYIEELENKHQGFVWSLYKALKDRYPVLNKDNYQKLAEYSKSGNYYHLVKNKSDYYNFFNDLESIIGDNDLRTIIFRDEESWRVDDFFFGDRKGCIHLRDLKPYFEVLTRRQFNAHISRLLSNHPENKLIVADYSSYTGAFSDLMRTLDDICFFELYPDGDKDVGIQSLNAKIFLINGYIDFQTDWSACNHCQAEELFRNLSVLFSENLLSRTYYIEEGSRFFVPQESNKFVMEILDLMLGNTYKDKDIVYFSELLTPCK